jgi:hypothetical protein
VLPGDSDAAGGVVPNAHQVRDVAADLHAASLPPFSLCTESGD